MKLSLAESYEREMSYAGVQRGNFPVRMLFRKRVRLPDMETILTVMEKHLGAVRLESSSKDCMVFSALDHMADNGNGPEPVQFKLLEGRPFHGDAFRANFLNMAGPPDDEEERFLRICRYQIGATDLRAAGLSPQKRANLDADFLEALAELFPDCEAFYIHSSDVLQTADAVRYPPVQGTDRFLTFAVNIRMMTKDSVEGAEMVLADTLGMNVLNLPDIQYCYEKFDLRYVKIHACIMMRNFLESEGRIPDGTSARGMTEGGEITENCVWECRRMESQWEPRRTVLNVSMGKYALDPERFTETRKPSESQQYEQAMGNVGMEKGCFPVRMLFQKPVSLPDREAIITVMEKHLGAVKWRDGGGDQAVFYALDHIAENGNGPEPVRFMLPGCKQFHEDTFSAVILNLINVMNEDKNRILRECRYQIEATDLRAAGLSPQERANLDADFIEALAELFPDCEALYFPSSGGMMLAEDVRSSSLKGPKRFLAIAANIRTLQKGDTETIVDTLGMNILNLPDVQYYFENDGLDLECLNWHISYVVQTLLEDESLIPDGSYVKGLQEDGELTEEEEWECWRMDSLFGPLRKVLNISMGEYALDPRDFC